jgi:hypothetical protein
LLQNPELVKNQLNFGIFQKNARDHSPTEFMLRGREGDVCEIFTP